jgi:bifunctional N-acetylglucosamine-1-phosphate-uridyltransferase/glucosamine-1-phosphate-acetyltransferase GlmU-like protein
MVFVGCGKMDGMLDGKRIGAVLLMGGEGRRCGGGVPKQYRLLGGKRVFEHALERMVAVGLFDEIVLVCHKDWMVEGAVYREGFKNREMPRRCSSFESGVAGAEADKLKKFIDAGGSQKRWLSDAGRIDFRIPSGIKARGQQ